MTDKKQYNLDIPSNFHTIDLGKPTYSADSPVQEKFHAQLFAKNKETVAFSNKTRCCCIRRPAFWYHTFPDGSQQLKWLSVAATVALAILVVFLVFLMIVFIKYSEEAGEDLSKHLEKAEVSGHSS